MGGGECSLITLSLSGCSSHTLAENKETRDVRGNNKRAKEQNEVFTVILNALMHCFMGVCKTVHILCAYAQIVTPPMGL